MYKILSFPVSISHLHFQDTCMGVEFPSINSWHLEASLFSLPGVIYCNHLRKWKPFSWSQGVGRYSFASPISSPKLLSSSPEVRLEQWLSLLLFPASSLGLLVAVLAKEACGPSFLPGPQGYWKRPWCGHSLTNKSQHHKYWMCNITEIDRKMAKWPKSGTGARIVEDLGCFVWRREHSGRHENCLHMPGGSHVEEGLALGCVVSRERTRKPWVEAERKRFQHHISQTFRSGWKVHV